MRDEARAKRDEALVRTVSLLLSSQLTNTDAHRKTHSTSNPPGIKFQPSKSASEETAARRNIPIYSQPSLGTSMSRQSGGVVESGLREVNVGDAWRG